MRYRMYRDVVGQWRWYLQSRNRRKVADSGEGYHNKGDCRAAIELVRRSCDTPIDEV